MTLALEGLRQLAVGATLGANDSHRSS